MNHQTFKVALLFCLISLISCSQEDKKTKNDVAKVTNNKKQTKKSKPHNYGGWYCPDNLNGFPPVDIENWKNIPVINGRMATKEEVQTEASLIFVDLKKYPKAKPLNIEMPKLAKFYNESSRREELIIVIQALNIDNDSIVGFRYLNGGNGSARLNEVKFLAEEEINLIPKSKFVSLSITIDATQDLVWKTIREKANKEKLESTFNKDKKLKNDWRKKTNLNFYYANSGMQTAEYADLLFGCYYIQNDYLQHNQKFLLREDEKTKQTELKIVCGPFNNDFETQKTILSNWAKKVKELSETK